MGKEIEFQEVSEVADPTCVFECLISKVTLRLICQHLFCAYLSLTLRPLRTSILVPPAAYVSCWGVAGAATHLSAVTQSCLLCRVASRESCPTFIPFRHDKNIEWYGYCFCVLESR